MPTVEAESKSLSISKARVCSVFIHAGCQATSTSVTKRLSSRTRQWPEYANMLLKRAALSTSFCGGWGGGRVFVYIKHPSARTKKKTKQSGPLTSNVSTPAVGVVTDLR